MELMEEDDWYTLPEAPLPKWLAVERLCRNRLMDQLGQHDETIDSMLKQMYVATVSSAASQLGLTELGPPPSSNTLEKQFQSFFIRVQNFVTSQRLAEHDLLNAFAIKISEQGTRQITEQINRLRSMIKVSDLETAKSKRLMRMLDEIEAEISRPKACYSRLMALLSIVGAGVVGGASFFADAPEAIGTITALIGLEKEEEIQLITDQTEEIKKLPPPIRPHSRTD